MLAVRERAVEYAERALRFSPLDPWIAHAYTALGIAHCVGRQLGSCCLGLWQGDRGEPALQPLRRSCRRPRCAYSGAEDEARAAARRVPELEPGFTVSGFVRSHAGRAEIWEPIGDALRRLGLPE